MAEARIYLPPELKRKLKEKAKEKGISLSTFIRQIVLEKVRSA